MTARVEERWLKVRTRDGIAVEAHVFGEKMHCAVCNAFVFYAEAKGADQRLTAYQMATRAREGSPDFFIVGRDETGRGWEKHECQA